MKKPTFWRLERSSSFGLCLAITLVAGCSTIPSGQPSAQTGAPAADPGFPAKVDKLSTIGEGAVIGAGVGAISGLIFGGKSGAAIGAGVGAVLGGAVGSVVADKQAVYASKEDYLSALLANAHKQNDELASVVESSKSYLKDEQQQVAQLRAKVATPAGLSTNDRAMLQHLQADAAIYQKAIKATNIHLDNLKAELVDYQTKYPGSDAKPIQASIDVYLSQRDQLVAVSASYDQMMKGARLNGST